MTVRVVSSLKATIMATILHEDVLSYLAALAGSIVVAPSSKLDPTRRRHPMFEPVHESAFDIMDKGLTELGAAF